MAIYNRLTTSRGGSGFGVSHIPISEIKDYFEMMGITDTEVRKRQLKQIQLIDSIVVNHHNSKEGE